MTSGFLHVFGLSQKLRVSSRGLRSVSSELHEISMNAALTASNSRSSHAEFAVVAREIGRISRGIDDVLNEVERITISTSNYILQSVQASEIHHRLTLGSILGDSALLHSRIELATSKTLANIFEYTERASVLVAILNEEIDRLEHIFAKDAAIVINIRITCQLVGLEESRVYLTIADAIQELNEKATTFINNLRRTARDMSRFFERQAGREQEVKNAA